MAERRKTPHNPMSFAANAAIVFSAALVSLPASATTDTAVPCLASERATLVVNDDALSVATVSHDKAETATNSLLAPRAEAAIRDAFDDGSAEVKSTTVSAPLAESVPDDDEADDEAMITRLPGVTDEELSRFRKQMFRRDI